jgi:hypothetical protein
VRVGVVGDSIGQPCGVHDHATLLAGALELRGMSCSLHWLSKSGGSLRASGAELRAWTRTLADELSRARADALLLHYSVFALSHRGVPLFVRPLLSALREPRLPLVTFMHEYAYPWRLGGLRGVAWAATQRVALIDAMRASSAVVVSADPRASWLRSRRWLPDRPVSVAPVFSNLPPAGADAGPVVADQLGLFGYAHEGVDAETVLDALALLREWGSPCRIVLLGAPGRDSSAGAPAAPCCCSRSAEARRRARRRSPRRSPRGVRSSRSTGTAAGRSWFARRRRCSPGPTRPRWRAPSPGCSPTKRRASARESSVAPLPARG